MLWTIFRRRRILISTVFKPRICSCEHENVSLAPLGANIAQVERQTSTDGVESMDPALKTLKAALETIRDAAMNALAQSERPQEQHSMGWKCKECRYVKHFTRPVTLEAAGRCPRCKSTEFRSAV